MRVFKFPLLLDPRFFEHAAHVWKGKLAKDESEENVFLLNSGAKSFQVPSCGSRTPPFDGRSNLMSGIWEVIRILLFGDGLLL